MKLEVDDLTVDTFSTDDDVSFERPKAEYSTARCLEDWLSAAFGNNCEIVSAPDDASYQTDCTRKGALLAMRGAPFLSCLRRVLMGTC